MPESMSRRAFAGTLAAAATQVSCTEAPRRPNLLFVFSDQHRACSMPGEPYNDADAPNLARLASEGMTFRNCVSNYPVCSPYRGILLSGRWPCQTGIIDNNFPLRESGYRTSRHMQGSYTFDPHNGERIEPKGYNATLMTDQAIEFIRKANADQPWMLVVSVNPPHPAFSDAPPELMQRYRDARLRLRPNGTEKLGGDHADHKGIPVRENLAGYYAHITAVDAEIGRLLDVLDETGAAGDTIVVYTSDHGEMMGSNNWTGKRLPYEESAKVPFVARFPGRIPAARTTDSLLGAIDLYPTLCGLAGVAPPEHCAGRDLSAALRGEQYRRPEHAFLMHQNVKGVNVPIYRGLRTPRYTYAAGERGRWLLFDNREDPYQRHNLAGDPTRSGLVRELEGEILEYLEVTGDPYPFAERVRAHA